MSTPPDTERRPVTETLHGEEVVDPYRWLEADADEVREWTERQRAYADEVLDTDVRSALASRFEDLVRVTDYGPLRPAGDRYLQQVKAPDEEQAVLYVRETPDGEGRSLIDPNEWSEEGTVSVDWFVPDEGGERLAYGVAEGGDEQYDVRVVDVDTGERVDEVPKAGRVNEGGFAWTDGGFFYTKTGGPDGDQLDKEVRYHELGGDPADDPVVADDFSRQEWPGLACEDGVLVVQYHEGWEHSEIYAVDVSDDPAAADLVPVVTDVPAAFHPHLDAGTLYLRTDHGADRWRALAVDVERALEGDVDPDEMRVAVPEGDAVLHGLTADEGRLVAHHHRDACSELAVYDDGQRGTEIPLPAFASVGRVETDGDHLCYTAESFDRPQRVCRVAVDDPASAAESATDDVRAAGDDAGTDDAGTADDDAGTAGDDAGAVLYEPDVGVDADLTVSREWFESADGTDVPAFVVRREDVECDGDNPTVLTGYGGFRVDRTPSFDRFRAPFLEAGGVFVLATLRGGMEYGESWHEDGRRANKQHVFDDAIAVAEGLADREYTRPERLGVVGGSNGGLLVGALLTQRPDLFGAALSAVPLLDMLRFHRFLLGASWTVEYGDPEDPEDFAYIREYSPYHNVEDRAYPPTMFTTAHGDTRVHPGHARKMTARLQAAQTGDAPVILTVTDETGHGVGKPASMLVREHADQWGFLCHALGVAAADLRADAA
jgi:prolyl oligopeptidase